MKELKNYIENNGKKFPLVEARKQNGLKRDVIDLVLNLAHPDDDCMLTDWLMALQHVLDKHDFNDDRQTLSVEVKNASWEEIEAGNNIIAEFTKTKRVALHYHSNWLLIMPVIVKLQTKGVDVWINYRNTQFEWSDDYNSYNKIGVRSETKILSIFHATVRFLKWVKENGIDLDKPEYDNND